MQRSIWRAVGSRKQWATQRLLSTSRDVDKPSLEQPSLKVWKHLTTKGDIPFTQHPGLSSENESSNPSLVGGPALPFKIRKINVELGDKPGPQEPERFFANESFLDPTLVGPPAESSKIRKINVQLRDKPAPQDPERSSGNEFLDPTLAGPPAESSKIRKIAVDEKADRPRPQAQNPERFSGNESLEPSSVDVLASKTREHAIEKGDTAGPHHPQRSSEPKFFLDPSPVGERKVTDASDIRLLMRRVPHSVAVITSNMPSHEPPESFCGMTVSSFNTVCLEPKIVVSFNVKQPSATYDAIQASGQFNVHLINSTVQGAAIAELFATGRGRETFKSDVLLNGDGEVSSSTLGATELEEREPDILRSNDVMFTLECKLLDPAVKVADHVIVLGEVLTHRLPPVVESWDGKSLGMCYVNRFYRRPGRVQLHPSERARLSEADFRKGATATSTSRSSNPEDGISEEDETIPLFY